MLKKVKIIWYGVGIALFLHPYLNQFYEPLRNCFHFESRFI